MQLPAKACVRLLNSTGSIGCATKADTLTVGSLVELDQPFKGAGMQPASLS